MKHYERDFDMIFHLKGAQNLTEKHYERDFDMIFYFKAAQNLTEKHYERDFDIIFHFQKVQSMVAKHMKEILAWFFTLRRLKTWLQFAKHYERDFDLIFYFKKAQCSIFVFSGSEKTRNLLLCIILMREDESTELKYFSCLHSLILTRGNYL